MFEPGLLENGIETGGSASRIQVPALEHVRIGEITVRDRCIEHRDTLVNSPIYAIHPGQDGEPFTINEVGIFPLAGGLDSSPVVSVERG